MKLPRFVYGFLRDQLLQRVAAKRPADVVIGGNYLFRWHVIPRNKWFNIYLHHFCRSDDDRALHDHPWWSCSVILKHGYYEVLPTEQTLENGLSIPDYEITYRLWRDEGQVVFRKATSAHRVLLEPLPDGEMPAWTLFITGPRIREWGFYCPQGWKHWQEFTAFKTSGDSRSVGPGCDP